MNEGIIEVQKAIVEGHLANNFQLLKKYSSSPIGVGGFDPVTFSASYELTGLENRDQYGFLPHFEFNVGTNYEINIPSESMAGKTVSIYHDFEKGRNHVINVPKESMPGETIYLEKDRIRLYLKAKNNGHLVEVGFPSVKDLFYLRNLANKGQLLSIPEVNDEDRKDLPIEENQIRADFYFRASSTTYRQLVAVMKIDHPDAEGLIKQYLETVDRRFDDYRGLEQYFKEKDDSGKVLWEDQNLQSWKYNSKRKKLHKALFGELKRVLKKGNLRYRIY